MTRDEIKRRISGCLIPIPTLFHDRDLSLNLAGMRRHVRFLLDGGVRTGNAVILVGGGAGEFSVMNVAERLAVAEAVVDEANGRVGVMVGAQSTSQSEMLEVARGAARMGAAAIQMSPPFYHQPTDDDVYEYIRAAADAADIGIVVYTTYWTGYKMSWQLLERLAEIELVAGLKWAVPSIHEYQHGVQTFGNRLCVIDNQLHGVMAHFWGARGINVHPGNYWPEWAVELWRLLEAGQYAEAMQSYTKVIFPYYTLVREAARYTGGEGHLDKLCMELIGFDTSRCRPPTRDIREAFRARARQMLIDCGVPRLPH